MTDEHFIESQAENPSLIPNPLKRAQTFPEQLNLDVGNDGKVKLRLEIKNPRPSKKAKMFSQPVPSAAHLLSHPVSQTISEPSTRTDVTDSSG